MPPRKIKHDFWTVIGRFQKKKKFENLARVKVKLKSGSGRSVSIHIGNIIEVEVEVKKMYGVSEFLGVA